MNKIVKGKSYIVFGNFPNPEGLAEQLSKTLEIKCLAFLSNTDNVSFVEYNEEDSELKALKEENSKLKSDLADYDKDAHDMGDDITNLNVEIKGLTELQEFKIKNIEEMYSRDMKKLEKENNRLKNKKWWQ